MSARGIPTIRSIICCRAPAPRSASSATTSSNTRLDGTAIDERGRAPYLERFIHGAIYEARPDVHAVVHNHSPSVIPFGVTGEKLKPLLHMCANFGHEVPVWDSHDKFGDTTLLVSDMAMGRDLAQTSGHAADDADARPRRHGGRPLGAPRRVRLGLSRNRRQAADAGDADGRDQIPLSAGEVDKIVARVNDYTLNRAWENWARRAGREMQDL